MHRNVHTKFANGNLHANLTRRMRVLSVDMFLTLPDGPSFSNLILRPEVESSISTRN